MCETSEALLLALAAAVASRLRLPNQFSGAASVPRKFEVAVETELVVAFFFSFFCLMKVK